MHQNGFFPGTMQSALLHLVDMGVLAIDVAKLFELRCAACIFAMSLVGL